MSRTEPAFAGGSDDDFLVHGDRTGDVDVLDVALASNLPALHTLDLSACEIENQYTDTSREALDVTLRRARREVTVVLP